MGVFVAIIFYIIFKSVRKLAAIIIFLQGGMDIVFIPLVNVFGASAGFAIDQIITTSRMTWRIARAFSLSERSIAISKNALKSKTPSTVVLVPT